MLPGIVPGKREGEIRVLGKDPSLLEPRTRVETCSYILQDPSSQLCTLTVRSEISLLLENRGEPSSVIEAETESVLKAFGIDHLAGRDLLALSGGEKQLVALAASAVALPGVLVLDEPCSYLDTENRARVLEFVRRLKEYNPELTLLIVEHRTDGLPLADLIFSVSNGNMRKILQPPVAWGSDFPKIARRTKDKAIPLLIIRDLTFQYSGASASRPVLNNLNLDLYKGEIAVLEGSNGSGKSTLLTVTAGALTGAAGKNTFSGTVQLYLSGPMPKKKEDYDNPILLIPQNPEHLFLTSTVMDELLHASTGDRQSAAGALNQFGLQGLGPYNPYTLSTGQKRRLNLAIASLSNAPLIFMDEPTFGLDGPGVCNLLKLMEQLRGRGKTLLVVTHDRLFAEAAADRILKLGDGCISGEPAAPVKGPEEPARRVRASFLGRRNPLVRAAGALLVIIGASFVSSLEATIAWLGVGTAAVLLLTSMSPLRLPKRLIPFALIGAGFLWANLLFHRGGGFSDGLNTGLLLFCRSLVFGVFSLTFVEDLDPEMFSHSLMHYLKLPPKLVYAVMIAFRIGPELKAEGEAIRLAISLREPVSSRSRSLRYRLKGTFRVFFGIFVAAFRRAGRIAVAMDGRGLDNTPRRLHSIPALSFTDAALFTGFCFVFIFPIVLFNVHPWNSGYF